MNKLQVGRDLGPHPPQSTFHFLSALQKADLYSLASSSCLFSFPQLLEQFHGPEKKICLGKEYFSWIFIINISRYLVLGLFPIREVSFCDVGEGSGTPLQHSCLENIMDEEAWWAAVHGVIKSQTWLSNFTFTFHFHALEKEMATHSSVLAWRIPGMGEPGGLPSVGSHRVEHDWSDLAAAAAAAFCKELGYYSCPSWLHICVPTPQFIWWRLISKVMASVCCCLKSNLIFLLPHEL